MDFAGKSVVVTGGGRGIGAAISRAFAAEGAAVAVNYRQDAAAAAATVAACEAAGGVAEAIQADVTDAKATEALIDTALDAFGKVDVLVNNAFAPYRFSPEARTPFWNVGWDDYQRQIDGSVKAAHGLTRAVLPSMMDRAEGAIINVASNLIARPVVPYHDYATAKAALVGFSRNLAAELGPLGIRVNTVAPGLVYPTDASRDIKDSLIERLSADTPLRRVATPEDVTGPVLFLASDWSRFMTGQVLYVDGGLVMG